MDEEEWLAEQFETHRGHLRAVAYRMLGSLSDADDAVQDTWLRLSRADTDEVENLGGWLTTVVARVCLNMLRARKTRGEESLDARVPDPDHLAAATASTFDPEQRGRAGRFRQSRAARRSRHPDPGGASRVRSARSVRASVRRDRTDGGAGPRRQPGNSPAGRGDA